MNTHALTGTIRTFAAALALVTVAAVLLAACGGGYAKRPTREALPYRGIGYDTGTAYGPGPLSREVWSRELMEGEIEAISEQLHANSISVYGTDIDRLVDTATVALENDLHVWIQPRLIDRPREATFAHLARTAREAERLREEHAHVGLNLGVESSLFVPGIVPGKTWWDRIPALSARRLDFHAVGRRLDAYLERAAKVARKHFEGEITYSAGPWEVERIDWSRFDDVGIDYYAFHANRAGHVRDLGQLRRLDKPIVVTEFGTNAFVGAPRLEGGGWTIVDYGKTPPEIRGKPVRDERVQADYLLDMLDVFESLDIRGAYVHTFVSPDSPYSTNPRYDYDLASFGIAKAIRKNHWNPASPYHWKPKLAFHALAERYGAAAEEAD
jgi:hypothetical protein